MLKQVMLSSKKEYNFKKFLSLLSYKLLFSSLFICLYSFLVFICLGRKREFLQTLEQYNTQTQIGTTSQILLEVGRRPKVDACESCFTNIHYNIVFLGLKTSQYLRHTFVQILLNYPFTIHRFGDPHLHLFMLSTSKI